MHVSFWNVHGKFSLAVSKFFSEIWKLSAAFNFCILHEKFCQRSQQLSIFGACKILAVSLRQLTKLQNFHGISIRANITVDYFEQKKTRSRNCFQSKCSHVNEKHLMSISVNFVTMHSKITADSFQLAFFFHVNYHIIRWKSIVNYASINRTHWLSSVRLFNSFFCGFCLVFYRWMQSSEVTAGWNFKVLKTQEYF